MTPRWPGTVETPARAAAFFDFDLVAHRGDGLGVRTDEDDPGAIESFGEARALGKKAVARMHRLGAGVPAGGEDVLHHQIALRRRRRADRDRHIRHFDVKRVAVGLGIDRNGLDTHAPGGLDDPAGDLAAVGNEDALEHFPF